MNGNEDSAQTFLEGVEGPDIPPRLRQELAVFGRADLLKKVGALHLDPHNARYLLGLDILAQAVVGESYQPEAPIISLARFRRVVSAGLGLVSAAGLTEPIRRQMFADTILFEGQLFVVFLGIQNEMQYTTHWLLQAALSLDNRESVPSWHEEIRGVASLCLGVSNAIARRAGLDPNLSLASEFSPTAVVPDSRLLRERGAAVTFTRAELAALLPDALDLDQALAHWTLEPGAVANPAQRRRQGELHHRPFVQAGDEYIVPIPALLLKGLFLRLLGIAREHGRLPELGQAFAQVIWQEAESLMTHWQARPVPLPAVPAPEGFREAAYLLAPGKGLYLQVTADPLVQYQENLDAQEWEAESLFQAMGERGSHMLQALPDQYPDMIDILYVRICQLTNLVRLPRLGPLPENCLDLFMTLSDLQVMTMLDASQNRSLWQFVRARENDPYYQVLTTESVLDQYALYRMHGGFFKFMDFDSGGVVVPVDVGRELREFTRMEANPHGVLSYVTGEVVTVWSWFKGGIPVSCPQYPGPRFALVVEGPLSCPIWVVGPEPEENLEEIARELVQMVAFWLWRLQKLLIPVLSVRSQERKIIVLQMEWDRPLAWKAASKGKEQAGSALDAGLAWVEATAEGMRLGLSHTLPQQLRRYDNQGERAFVHALLTTVRAILTGAEGASLPFRPDPGIEEVLAEIMPPGPRRMIVRWTPDPLLDPGSPVFSAIRWVPDIAFRQVQSQIDAHMDTKPYIEPDTSLFGATPYKREVLTYLWGELKQILADLDAVDLLAKLVARYERYVQVMVGEKYRSDALTACLGEETVQASDLSWLVIDHDREQAGYRFLLEYVATQPPAGTQPCSMACLDRLLALVTLSHRTAGILGGQIWEEDGVAGTPAAGEQPFLGYSLFDLALDIWDHQRWDFDPEEVMNLQRKFMAHLLDDPANLFQMPPTRTTDQVLVMDEELEHLTQALDQAIALETGFSFTEWLRLMDSIYRLGQTQSQEAKRLSVRTMVSRLSSLLAWDEDKVRRGLDFMSLAPGNPKVHPARTAQPAFNPTGADTPVAYMNHPLIWTGPREDPWIVWGNRHLIQAMCLMGYMGVTGRITGQSEALQQACGQWQAWRQRRVRDKVGQILTDSMGIPTQVGVVEVGNLNIRAAANDPGAIDVLGVLTHERIVLVADCVHFGIGLPDRVQEIRENQLQATDTGGKTVLYRHEDRVLWVRQHLDDILQQGFGIRRKRRWRVLGLLISDVDPAYLLSEDIDMPFPEWSVLELQQMTRREFVADLNSVQS